MHSIKKLFSLYCVIFIASICASTSFAQQNEPSRGLEVVLELDTRVLKERLFTTLLNDIREKLDDNKLLPPTPPQRHDDAFIITFSDYATAQNAATVLDQLNKPIANKPSQNTVDTIIITQLGRQLALSFTSQALAEQLQDARAEVIDIIRYRIAEMDTEDFTIQPEENDRIRVQLLGVQDSQQLRRVLSKTAKLAFHLVHTDINPNHPIPSDVVQVESDDGYAPFYFVERRPALDGTHMADADSGSDGVGRPAVNIRLDKEGARIFAYVTTQNIGKQFAIILDDKVISAPNINEPITGGSASITGQFTRDDANALAAILRHGPFSLPVTIIEEHHLAPHE